jgi:hypothetical protein
MPMHLIPDIAVFQKKLATLPLATYQADETVLSAASTTGRLLILKEGAPLFKVLVEAHHAGSCEGCWPGSLCDLDGLPSHVGAIQLQQCAPAAPERGTTTEIGRRSRHDAIALPMLRGSEQIPKFVTQ